ncbi:hypothetical protein P168DRAFT_171811 [Aspergillus campestris IBT 28561]|uniref:Uncharacterized protein n=1 Tax=Aspergillus campestris (strain IBT 28561) TaxID=1392248 RepID=A0A2I1D270_ASPC2|nr:uncharacterized protein P168DRAFT_171811 [Aspergillus campestris IBT 28561]PKY03938.1 hypothetical protein P168DRAFT_171811 [Aspergillus campestris IBT 28561]
MHSVTRPNEILLDDHGDVVIHVLFLHAIFRGLITGCYNCFMVSEDRFNRSSPKVPSWRVAWTRHVHCIDEINQFDDSILPWNTSLLSIRMDRFQIYTLAKDREIRRTSYSTSHRSDPKVTTMIDKGMVLAGRYFVP